MGIKQILVDDLDGRDLPSDTKPQSVTFEGKKYDVYLSAANAERFRAFLSGEKPLTGPSAFSRSSSGGRGVDRTEKYGFTAKEVREWATESGHTIDGKPVPAQGKVSQAWYDAMNEAKGSK